ncbi:MAG: methyl-accepting chemotaxis protein [Lachnospiraceae bacterium]|nr:methyl-accepting chemotaxis protein [Lachnospiraceae bacterium]
MKKISHAIVLSIALSVIAAAGICTALSINMNAKTIISECKEKIAAISGEKANEMDISFKKYEVAVEGIEVMIKSNFDASKVRHRIYNDQYVDELESFAAENAKTYPEIKEMFIYINPEYSGNVSAIDYKNGERQQVMAIDDYKLYLAKDPSWDFYFKVAEKGGPVWLDPAYDESLGCTVITYSNPIYVDDILVAVAGFKVDFSEITNTVNSIKVYNTGHAFLVNDDNRFIIHKEYGINDTLESAGYTKLAGAVWNGNSGSLEETVNGELYYVSYSKMNTGYTLVVLVPAAEAAASTITTAIACLVAALVIIAICVVIAIFVGTRISSPIVKVVEDVKLMQNGDFTGDKHSKYINKKNEIGALSKAIAAVQDSMKDTVGTINNSAADITGSVAELKSAVHEFVEEVTGVSAISQELAATMQETTATADNLSSASDNMAAHVEEAGLKNTEGMETVKGISERARKLREESVKAADASDIKARETEKTLAEAIEKSKQVEQITELTDTILNIADETGLLALNASIEAARAGEAGKGFAVVADSISKLADSSQDSAKQIQAITNSVTETVRNLCDSANDALRFVNEDLKAAYQKLIDTSNQYDKDAADMREILEGLQESNDGVQREIETVVGAFEGLKAATAEGAKGTTEVANEAERLTHTTDLVTGQNAILDEVAKALERNIAQFKVS